MLYLGAGKLEDKDIPHRHKMTDSILDAYKKQIAMTKDELERAEGRISFTTDLWSDPSLDSYMAVSAHYYVRNEHRQLKRRNGLIAFRFVEGSHTGINLAQNFIKILEELNILGKVSLVNVSD
jgi:hypothetical protein